MARLPLASLVLETDAPDQPDVDWRGRRNEPARLVRILQALTELRRESPEASYAKAMELFAPGEG